LYHKPFNKPKNCAMTDTATVGAYIRVSTEKQKEEESHKRQRKRIGDWAEENGYGDGVEYYQDIAISGQSDNRDDYERLMTSYENHDYIVVRELSRFGRDPVKVLTDVEEIMESDVEFVSVTEPMLDSTSAHGKLMLRQIAAINGFMSDIRSEQAKRMAERRKEKGLPVGRPRKLDPNEMEDVYEWREMGHSYASVAALVEQVHGVEISRQTIRRYIKEYEEPEQAT